MKHFRPHLFVIAALVIVLSSGLHGALRNALVDQRFAWDTRKASGEIVIVAIDAPSIEGIGVWPWPRKIHADMLRRLETAGAHEVVFDIDFSTPSDAASDRAFADALESAGGSVVLPSFEQPGAEVANGSSVHINRPLKQFADHSWSAVVNVNVGPDGLVRRYGFGETLDGEFLPSMGAMLAGQYTRQREPFLIDFGIRAASIPKVSYIDVLRGDAATLDRLSGKKVIIGGTALELGDRFSIPNGGIVSGPVLQALAAESIMQNRALHLTSGIIPIAGLGLIALVMMLSWRRLAASRRSVLLVAIAAAIEISAILLQGNFPLIPDTSILHTMIALYLAAIAVDEIDFRGLLGRIAENRFQRIAMSLGDGLVCTDQNHLITAWNPGAEAIFGYSAADMMGRPFDLICARREDAPTATVFENLPVRSLPGGMVREFDGLRSNGEVFPLEACFFGWQGTVGHQYGAILRDISVRKREAERIRFLAEHDSLTGLANRNSFREGLSTLVSTAEKREGKVALLVIGLDGFQQINDMLGHATGDLVLCAVAERLKTEAGSAAIIARLSGDEFAVAVCCDGEAAAAGLSGRIVNAFEDPLLAGTRQRRLSVSIGAAVGPADGRTADELLTNGHLAFCRAKAIRRGSYVMFENAIRRDLESRLTLEAELARAVEQGEFELFYQPKVRLADGSLTGTEALIRWHHPRDGLVPPRTFMPVVNTSPMSDPIAGWVLRSACRQASAWERSGHPVRVSVNLSPSQFRSGDLASQVAEELQASGLSPSLLELEVTEDILLLDEEKVLDIVQRIQKLGVHIVFDDFGTGYASLSYLKKFPLSGLKIDKSFVFEMLVDSSDAAIVRSTVSLGRQLGLSVIAEGIENRATADLLMSMGCEEGQGYLFGRPMPAQSLESQFLSGREPGPGPGEAIEAA